jgi:hypothetical protein
MRQFCADRPASFKVPVKIQITEAPVHSARFKRVRSGESALAGASTPGNG